MAEMNCPAQVDRRIVLVIPAPKTKRDSIHLNGVVRISEEAELALLELCGKTGLSMKSVASALIVQAASICEVRKGGEAT